MFQKKRHLIGIDIGSSSVKLVQLKEVRGGYQLMNLGMAPLPPDAIVDNAIMDSSAVVSVVRDLLLSLKIKEKQVATSVSGHSVIIRNIQLPIMTEEEMESSIPWEAEQYIPFEDIRLSATGLTQDDLLKVKDILLRYKGDIPVFLRLQKPSRKDSLISVGREIRVTPSDQLIREIEILLGDGSVSLN